MKINIKVIKICKIYLLNVVYIANVDKIYNFEIEFNHDCAKIKIFDNDQYFFVFKMIYSFSTFNDQMKMFCSSVFRNLI